MKKIIGSLELDQNGNVVKINRGNSRQGYIYKNPDAYYKNDGICYVPELSDSFYTAQDFLSLADGSEDVADSLFERVDWQHPESLLDEDIIEGELGYCIVCGRLYYRNETSTCDDCKEKLIIKEEI